MGLRIVVVSAVAMVWSDAAAGPDRRFEVVDHGDHVEVIASGVTMIEAADAVVVRERIEIPLDGAPRPGTRLSEDDTVRLVEIRGGLPRVLSMKLRLEHAGVVGLHGHATWVQEADGVHVTIPRRIPVPTANPMATAPLVPAAVSVPPPVLPRAVEAVPTAATAVPEPPPIALPVATTLPTIGVTGPAMPARVAPTGTNRWLLIAVGALLIGGGVAAVLRRKRRSPIAGDELEVIASRSLGGKSRVVWLGAGQRELLVSVSPQAVRLLGSWRRGDRGERSLEPIARPGRDGDERLVPREDDPSDIEVARIASTRSRPSPAVSGILRLRERAPKLAVDIASEDSEADEQWARDILAATGGRR